MYIQDFEKLKTTTMTVVVKLEGNINKDTAFPLLKITKLDMPKPFKITKNFKIPYCGIPGAILSANYKGVTRGIIKSLKMGYFRNSISIDLCTSKKNINAKLSSGTIHMCGTDSIELSKEGAQHLIDHLYKIQDNIDYINQNIGKAKDVIKWIKQNVKNKKYIINELTDKIITIKDDDKIGEDGKLRNREGQVYMIEDQRKINEKKKCRKGKKSLQDENNNFKKFIPIVPKQVYSLKIPEGTDNKIDHKIYKFFIQYITDYAYYSDYCKFIESILNVKNVIDKPVKVKSILIAMINYSYELGFDVNRLKLAQYINMNKNSGFYATYNNTSDCYVKIELPYEPTDNMKKIRKKDKIPKHTFMVYKTGIVTQSGPNVEYSKQAYYKFMNIIYSISHLIRQKGKPYRLKYKPVYSNT